jgi:metallo-beta-lactamase family protein
MKLGFHGAARTVTGSKYLLDTGQYRLMIDCGLFQGGYEMHQRNWKDLGFSPSSVDDVLFTHAHIDHTGLFPRFVKQGFSGRGLASPPTKGLLGVLLPDSGGLQEEEARFGNKKGVSRHTPAFPLYTESDAIHSLRRLTRLDFNTPTELHPGVEVTLHRAGHILGAAFVSIRAKNRNGQYTRILFSGDMGRRGEPIPDSNYIIVETTYGDRRHKHVDVKDQIKAAITEGVKRGGLILIPAFAVGRTQEILYHLFEMFEAGFLERLPVFVDSPMANSVVDLYCRYHSEHDVEMQSLQDKSGDPLHSRYFTVCRSREDSKRLNDMDGPAIVISASGMATGGRILHHLVRRLGDPKTTVLFVGYQAEGTLGRQLVEGEPEVKVLGEYVRVQAAIRQLPALSAHADCDELIDWLKTAPKPPKALILTHGEPAAQEAFKALVGQELGWPVLIPEHDEIREL